MSNLSTRLDKFCSFFTLATFPSVGHASSGRLMCRVGVNAQLLTRRQHLVDRRRSRQAETGSSTRTQQRARRLFTDALRAQSSDKPARELSFSEATRDQGTSPGRT